MAILNKLVAVVYRYTSRWAYNWGGGLISVSLR